jgi:enterochelin esterase-like enzyme
MHSRVCPLPLIVASVAVVVSACAGRSNAGMVSDRAVVTTHGAVTGDLRIHDLNSRIFGNVRKLRVWLPEGYDAPENRHRLYPVLYLNDGQNLFDSTTAIFNPMEWRVDETVAQLIASRMIPPMIVVGIDNAGRRLRAREYLPYVDEFLHPPEPNPRGKEYPEFLTTEVLPFVSSRYRVSRDQKHVGIGGSSYGALAALFSAMSHPELFGLLLMESPSLYVDDAHVLRDAERRTVWPRRVYLGVGTNEEGRAQCDPAARSESEAVADVRRLERIFLGAGLDSSRVRVVVVPCAVHNEAAWAARLPLALKFLFGD